jgi:hypothetical protein
MKRDNGYWTSCFAVFTTVATILGWIVWRHYPFIERALAFEDSPIAWVSSSVLIACATLSFAIVQQRAHPRQDQLAWIFLTLLLLLAALDERFQLHETFKSWLLFHHYHGDVKQMQFMGDLPMAGYPAAGMFFIYWFGKRVASPGMFAAAIVVGAVAVGMDIATENIRLQMLEEVLEVLAETLFLCGLLIEHRSMWTKSVQSPDHHDPSKV